MAKVQTVGKTVFHAMSVPQARKINRTSILLYSAVILGQTIWGFSFMASRIGLQYAEPLVLLADRFLLAFFVMNLCLLSGKFNVNFKGKPMGKLLLLSLCSPILNLIFENYGIRYTNSTYAGLNNALSPIMTMLLGAFILKEYPSKKSQLFSLLPVFGVGIIAISGQSNAAVNAIGFVFLAGACITAGLFRIGNRIVKDQFTAFERTYSMMGLGALSFTITALFANDGNLLSLAQPFVHRDYCMAIIFLGAFCSCAAFGLVNYSLNGLPASVSALFSTLTTVVSILAGAIFLGEPFSPIYIVGACCIVYGIYKASISNEKNHS